MDHALSGSYLAMFSCGVGARNFLVSKLSEGTRVPFKKHEEQPTVSPDADVTESARSRVCA